MGTGSRFPALQMVPSRWTKQLGFPAVTGQWCVLVCCLIVQRRMFGKISIISLMQEIGHPPHRSSTQEVLKEQGLRLSSPSCRGLCSEGNKPTDFPCLLQPVSLKPALIVSAQAWFSQDISQESLAAPKQEKPFCKQPAVCIHSWKLARDSSFCSAALHRQK